MRATRASPRDKCAAAVSRLALLSRGDSGSSDPTKRLFEGLNLSSYAPADASTSNPRARSFAATLPAFAATRKPFSIAETPKSSAAVALDASLCVIVTSVTRTSVAVTDPTAFDSTTAYPVSFALDAKKVLAPRVPFDAASAASEASESPAAALATPAIEISSVAVAFAAATPTATRDAGDTSVSFASAFASDDHASDLSAAADVAERRTTSSLARYP